MDQRVDDPSLRLIKFQEAKCLCRSPLRKMLPAAWTLIRHRTLRPPMPRKSLAWADQLQLLSSGASRRLSYLASIVAMSPQNSLKSSARTARSRGAFDIEFGWYRFAKILLSSTRAAVASPSEEPSRGACVPPQ